MAFVKTFEDLEVYKFQRELSKKIFAVSRTFPKEEMYSLTDQIRRSSRSIGANISEAWGKRRYEKHFVSKLTDADAEQLETQHWLLVARDCEYLSSETVETLKNDCLAINRMLNSMMLKASQFCNL
ncbi:four helix bundle protein [Leeuwenhoekiella nanhaiensis]|uniref:Four helix bundle protein n=1 Tax=Leeuwenhoekiella nanhaiensis TaxID=1655491 RepID=A0A2G1VQR6_9FLAO|nr:four helix bundle protein [Leeuwenhoekiella nanhaiensis]PHQ29117.1 four helix bundle protein [Leeuwenhoekiella nanhaiensis]